jgi:hypothetical protein
MAALGFRCGKDALARMLHGAGYSLQGMSRTVEGRQHPDRDAQFRLVSMMTGEFTAAGGPVASADGKNEEQLGPYYRAGRSWRPGGDPVRVRDHGFAGPGPGEITPCGVCGIAANRGFAVAGTSHDTAAFAAGAVRRWWRAEGALRYPGARRLLVTCDAGGSSACASRLWKDQLAVFAAEAGPAVTVCRFPPGTSKRDKIGHRLFCHVTRTWKSRPLMTKEDAVAGIAATTACQGLKCTAVLDEGGCPLKVKVSDERMRHLEDRVPAAARSTASGTARSGPPPPGRNRSRPPARRPARTWKDWPRWPASATSPPCWAPSPSRSPRPASSGCTAAASVPAAAARERFPATPSSPPPPATCGSACPAGCPASSSAPTSPPSASPPAASRRSWQRTALPPAAPQPASRPASNCANTPPPAASP